MTRGSLESRGVVPYAVLMPLAPWEHPSILRQALRSLEIQSWPPDEVIVSCDGSPPSALRAVLDQATLPIQLVLGPGGEGVGPVLARGLVHCHQDFIVRADADDLSMPERCATQLGWLKSHPHVVALGCVIDEFISSPADLRDSPTSGPVEDKQVQRSIVSSRWVPESSKEISHLASIRNPLNHPSVVLRRQEVLAIGNYRSRPGFEDYDLWLRILAAYGACALANLPQSLVLARVGEAHLRRRHGVAYALSEVQFFWTCGREGLLTCHAFLLALLIRIPLRLLPARLLALVMQCLTRRTRLLLPSQGRYPASKANDETCP